MLLPFFEWMEGVAVYGSTIYLGPAVNIVHLCAMVTFLGALMVVDLRLLGAGLTHQPVAVVARDARPWLLGALVMLVLTGVPALMATATLQYGNSVFWVKMYLLGLGLLFTFTVRNRVAFAEEGRVRSGHGTARRPAVDPDLAQRGGAGAAHHDDSGQHLRVAGRG